VELVAEETLNNPYLVESINLNKLRLFYDSSGKKAAVVNHLPALQAEVEQLLLEK